MSEFFVYFVNKHCKFFVYCGSKHRGVFHGTINGAFVFLFGKLNFFNHSFRPISFLLMTSPLSFRLEASKRSRFSNSPFGISALHLLAGGFNHSILSILASLVYMFSFRQSKLVFVDTLSPFAPKSLGRFKYAIIFVDQQTKWKEVVLIMNKTCSVDALALFVTETVISTGECFHTLRGDRGTELSSAEFRQYFQDLGIKM